MESSTLVLDIEEIITHVLSNGSMYIPKNPLVEDIRDYNKFKKGITSVLSNNDIWDNITLMFLGSENSADGLVNRFRSWRHPFVFYKDEAHWGLVKELISPLESLGFRKSMFRVHGTFEGELGNPNKEDIDTVERSYLLADFISFMVSEFSKVKNDLNLVVGMWHSIGPVVLFLLSNNIPYVMDKIKCIPSM